MACMQDPFQAQSSPVRSPHQELKREAHVLAEDLISYRIGKRSLPPSRASATLRRLSDELEERHAVLLNTMCSRLNINHNTARIRFVQVADEVFQEGINWGRIVALFTFGGRLAQFCMRNGMASNVEDVTTWVGDYVAGKADWISRQGGWAAFDHHFQDPSQPERIWWRTACLAAVGIGAFAMLVYRETCS